MTTTLRAAAPGDEVQLAGLVRFVQDLHLLERPDRFRATVEAELVAWFGALLEKPTTRIWIAENSGKPLGYIVALMQQLPATPVTPIRNWCELDQLVVDPYYRRRGIASALIRQAVAEARDQGIEAIETTSWAFNTAMHQLLEQVGFTPKTLRFELRDEPAQCIKQPSTE